MNEYIKGKVLINKYWTDKLFSLIITANINSFTAGQFTKLGLKINNKIIKRAYSYVNSPLNKNLEFYITTVPKGKLSLLLYKLKPNDKVIVEKEAKGCLTLNNIPNCENLWMISTGTAIGPYLSILEHKIDNIERFKKIILINSVRFSKDLNYLTKILKLKEFYKDKLYIQTIVSKEYSLGSLHGRVTNLIDDNILEKNIGIQINPKNTHIMLCGNPHMVHDMQKILINKRGMLKHLKNNKGHITSENYW